MACSIATKKEDDDAEAAMQRSKPKVVQKPVVDKTENPNPLDNF